MATMSLVERAKAAAKKQAENRSGGGSLFNKAWKPTKGLPSFKMELTPPDGQRTNLRIVPYTMTDPRNNPDCEDVGVQWFKRRYWTHKVGIDEVRVCCLARTFGKPCPVCQHRRKLQSEGAPDELLRKFNSSERELFNVYDYGTKTLRLFDASTFLFGNGLRKEANDPSNEGADAFVSPDKDGMILSCRWDAGTMKDTIKLGSVKFVPAKTAIPQEILDKAEDLDKILVELTADEILVLMDGGAVSKKEEKKGQKDADVPEKKEKAVESVDMDF